MRAVVVFAVMVVASGYGLVTGFKVEPVKASWSGKTDPEDGVAQVITINFDELDVGSGAYVELFAGEYGGGGEYNLDILTYPGGTPIASKPHGKYLRPQHWVRFDSINVTYPESIVKGKKLEFRFTRSGSDSVQYYYAENAYDYGHIVIGGGESQPPPGNAPDLCMRAYGRMNPVSDVWRACANFGDEPNVERALDSAESIGIKWLRDGPLGWEGWASDTGKAMSIYNLYLGSGFNMMGILCYGRKDSVSSYPRGDTTVKNTELYPPRNLDSAVTDTCNFWAGYCRSIMDSMPNVKYWEVWNEPNAPWFWRNPDDSFYGSEENPIDTRRERCSLYVRMCQIAESVAKVLLTSGQKIVGGATYRLRDGNEEDGLSSGADWLRDMFDLAKLRYGGVEKCFDMVSVHPYMWGDSAPNNYFNETSFRLDLDTARAVMRVAGYPDMELWATEYGWPRWACWWDTLDSSYHTAPLTDTLMLARDLGQFYASAIARQADPRGGYDRAFWYELTGYRTGAWGNMLTQGFGLLDTCPNQPRLPHSLDCPRFAGHFLRRQLLALRTQPG